MYEQEFQGDVLYMMFYAVVAALNLVACCYLLFRRGNAFANSDIEYTTLHVPTTSIDAYKKTAPWSGFKTLWS